MNYLLDKGAFKVNSDGTFSVETAKIRDGVAGLTREIMTLQCTDCKERNYSTTKNKKKNTERLETKKFCPRCRHHTVHRETK